MALSQYSSKAAYCVIASGNAFILSDLAILIAAMARYVQEGVTNTDMHSSSFNGAYKSRP
jgi:hypothetical protein